MVALVVMTPLNGIGKKRENIKLTSHVLFDKKKKKIYSLKILSIKLNFKYLISSYRFCETFLEVRVQQVFKGGNYLFVIFNMHVNYFIVIKIIKL